MKKYRARFFQFGKTPRRGKCFAWISCVAAPFFLAELQRSQAAACSAASHTEKSASQALANQNQHRLAVPLTPFPRDKEYSAAAYIADIFLPDELECIGSLANPHVLAAARKIGVLRFCSVVFHRTLDVNSANIAVTSSKIRLAWPPACWIVAQERPFSGREANTDNGSQRRQTTIFFSGSTMNPSIPQSEGQR